MSTASRSHNGGSARYQFKSNHLLSLMQKKSDTYKQMMAGTLQWLGRQAYRYSCQGICGSDILIHGKCSCDSACLMNLNCCYDFFDKCAHIISFNEFSQAWSTLENVHTQCPRGVMMATSCPARNNSQTETRVSEPTVPTEVPRFAFASNSSSSNEFHSSKGQAGSISTTTAAVHQRILNLLNTSEYWQNMTDLEVFLMSTPVTDATTGINHKNMSVFHCNGRNLSEAVPWSLRLQLGQGLPGIPSASTRSLVQTFPYLDLDTMDTMLREDRIHYTCDYSVSSCSDSFHEEDVRTSVGSYSKHYSLE